jgi:transcriptional regulator with XRE-family HTH domain
MNNHSKQNGGTMVKKNFILYFRKKVGLSQKQLAELTGISEMSIRRYESGERDPRASDIKKLAETLGVTDAALLNGPVKNELKIEFIWEVEDMDVANIESNKFYCGFRGNDVLLWGALSDDEDDESVARKIMKQIRAARIGKQATNEALKKMEG